MTLKEIAELTGTTEADVAGFVECLRLWVAKGFSFEEAIARHMAQMERLANHAVTVARDPEIKTAVASDLWDAVNKAAA